MLDFNLQANNITKYFVKKHFIFKNLSLNIQNNEIVGLIGDNGSGKSTLLKILAGILSPSNGNIKFMLNNQEISLNHFNNYYSYVAPYLNLYEEFTPYEHYKIVAKIRNILFDENKLDNDLKFFKLYPYKHLQIKGFSSGMKQRYKFILATQKENCILFLDEPTSNLDEDGINKVKEVINKHIEKNGAVVIATNEERERILCNKIYNMMDYK
jgi:heme exporter protein A